MSWVRNLAILVVAALPVVVAVAGCADPEPKPPAGASSFSPGMTMGGGGEVREGGAESGIDAGDGGGCNDIVNEGQTVDRIGVIGEPPVAQGGVVAEGTYRLTSYLVYVGAGGIAGPTQLTAKATIRLSAGKFDELIELGGSGNPSIESRSSAYSAVGATFALNELCPTTTAGKQFQYTSNDPVLVLTNLSSKEAFTFTKR